MPVLGTKSPTPALKDVVGRGRKRVIKCGGSPFRGGHQILTLAPPSSIIEPHSINFLHETS